MQRLYKGFKGRTFNYHQMSSEYVGLMQENPTLPKPPNHHK
ncbi:MAG: hypothetical protein ACKPKT_00745 [Dolichospermum sp.]